jgi:hypothetical protein
MDEVVLYFDFEDVATADIYAKRFFDSAKIIGVTYKYQVAKFGDTKVHLKVNLSGHAPDIEMFIDFMNKSISLLDEAQL